MAAYRRVYDSRQLQADWKKNRDQLRNPTLGNRVWATFTILAAIFEGTWLLPAYGSLVTVAVVYETRILPAFGSLIIITVVYETRSIIKVVEETCMLPTLESLALVSVVWASSKRRS